jgi:ubiquinone/menaquinone biosynthesis C-methylase UbiE
MSTTGQAIFDSIAHCYDALWSNTAVGTAQRGAVWRELDGLFTAGDLVLDLGCGTGVDALHLQAAGLSVYGVDSSSRMVEIARAKRVDAHHCRIEDLDLLEMQFDGAISNFGVLNCVSSLDAVACALARLVRPGGRLALCFLSRICLWEIGYYLLRAKPRKAFRRLAGRSDSSLGVTVSYPSHREILSAFKDDFRLTRFCGIGCSVPPSYVRGLTNWEIETLSALDVHLTRKPFLRALADHALYIFERL